MILLHLNSVVVLMHLLLTNSHDQGMNAFNKIVENKFITDVKIGENSDNDLNKCIEDIKYENGDEIKSSKCDISNCDGSQESKLEVEEYERSQLIKTQTSTTENKNLKNELHFENENTQKNNGTINDHYIKSNELSENYFITETNRFSRISPNWKQFISASGPVTLYFAAGISSGYSATLLPHLREEHSAILQNESSTSWIASIAVLPLAPCCFIGGLLIEKFGRRRTLGALGIPFFIGWIVVILSNNLTQMLIGRFINGCCIGIMMPSMSVFISESTSPKLRGMFLSLLTFSFAFGILISHLIGTWVSWQWTAIISAIFPLISVIILLFVPESPVWLLSKGKIDDGIKAFYWLRGYGENARLELKAMLEKFTSPEISNSSRRWRENLEKFSSPEFFKPLSIMIIIYLTCQFSGVHAVTFYSIDIVEKATSGGIDRYVAMLTIDTLRVITTLIAIFFSKNCARRLLSLISGSLSAASMLGLSIFLYFYNNKIPSQLTAVPLCFLCVFIIAVNIGLIPLPVIVVGEIFPANVRSFGAGISSSIGLFSIFIVVKTAPGMMADLGQVFTFSFYGIISLIGTIVLFFILPETKGKSLLEIEAIFKRKKSSQNTP